MKIGILTFHNANNYGAVLQAYGLKLVLQDMGHEVKIINYCNRKISECTEYFNFFSQSPLRVIKRLLFNYHVLSSKTRQFETFREKYLGISKVKVCPEDLLHQDCDLFIVGSDQVWNPLLTGGPDPVYWGCYSGGKPIITYAASSNDLSCLPIDMQSKILSWLPNFFRITVRENRLSDYIKTHTGVTAPVVVDPTLLAGKQCWDKLLGKRPLDDSYLLYYSVENTLDRQVAISLAKNKGLRIVVLSKMQNKYMWPKDTIFLNLDIPDFIAAFRFADIIVCTSFHGTVFSILFERDFYSVEGGNMARVESLLKPLGLMDRVVSNGTIVKDCAIDYSFVNNQLLGLQNNSKEILAQILNDVMC